MNQAQLKQWVKRIDSITSEFAPIFEKAQIWQPSSENNTDLAAGVARIPAATGGAKRLKYQVGDRFPYAKPDAIAMWIADMDTHPLASIAQSCSRFLSHNYGYQALDIGKPVSQWFDTQGVRVSPASVVGVASVICGVDIALSLLTQAGDKVMLLSPTYGPLRERILSQQLKLIDIPICKLAHTKPEGIKQLMAQLQPEAKALVVCHPNNPTGAILPAETQQAIAAFCDTHNITIISDEVHSEFGYQTHAPKQPVLPFAYGYTQDNEVFDDSDSIGLANDVCPQDPKDGCLESQNEKGGCLKRAERTQSDGCLKRVNSGCQKKAESNGCLKNGIHFNSVSKAFNLAAIPGASYALIENEALRQRFTQAIDKRHLAASPLSIVALTAAYEHGLPWLNKVREAIHINRQYTHAILQQYPLDVSYCMGQAGYFLWLDLRSHLPTDTFKTACERGVIGVDGTQFNAPGFLRLNLACHPGLIAQALKRLFA